MYRTVRKKYVATCTVSVVSLHSTAEVLIYIGFQYTRCRARCCSHAYIKGNTTLSCMRVTVLKDDLMFEKELADLPNASTLLVCK